MSEETNAGEAGEDVTDAELIAKCAEYQKVLPGSQYVAHGFLSMLCDRLEAAGKRAEDFELIAWGLANYLTISNPRCLIILYLPNEWALQYLNDLSIRTVLPLGNGPLPILTNEARDILGAWRLKQ